jgi:hypothetical protein
VALLAFDQLAGVKAMRINGRPPLYLAIAGHQTVGKSIGGWEPAAPRVGEPEKKQGALSTGSAANPNSRLGRKPSPHSQGRVMEHPASPSFVGIDVSKVQR